MGTKKKTVLVICGGRSTEHSVSLLSAKNVLAAIGEKKYQRMIVVIDLEGVWRWVTMQEFEGILEMGVLENGRKRFAEVVCAPNTDGRGMRLLDGFSGKALSRAEVVFPVMHGRNGEDGTLQGMLEMMRVPYVGPGVFASAACMDKEMTKRLLKEAGVETTPFRVLHRRDAQKNSFREYKKLFGLPFFIKPARAGSSVGVHRVCNEREFFLAIREAFLYDDKIIVEEMIVGREIECSVLGDGSGVRVSVPGEVVVLNGYKFYSYASKYADEAGASLYIPAKLSQSVEKRVRQIAERAYRALGCEGMARADFFVTMRGRVYVNELNTLPGFTDKSMFPKLWECERIKTAQLAQGLIRDALQRGNDREKMRNRYEEK